MQDSPSSDREGALFKSSHSQSSDFLLRPTDDDAGLLSLEAQFNELAAELVAGQNASDAIGLEAGLPTHGSETGQDAKVRKAEAILARLDPIERAIMATPARTIAGLGVKARHAGLCNVPLLGSAHRSHRLGRTGSTSSDRSGLRLHPYTIALSELSDDGKSPF